MDAAWRMIGFVPVRDEAAARGFYEGVLGMRFVEQNPFAVVMEANGTTVRLVTMGEEFRPVAYTICGWEVPEIEAAVRGLRAAGVAMERYPFAEGEIWTAPGGNRIAWFKDPDGNVLSVSQHTAGVDLGL